MRINSRALRRYRILAGLTQEELGERVGVTRASVCAWEAGTMPRPGALRRVAEVLDVPPEELVEEEDSGEVAENG